MVKSQGKCFATDSRQTGAEDYRWVKGNIIKGNDEVYNPIYNPLHTHIQNRRSSSMSQALECTEVLWDSMPHSFTYHYIDYLDSPAPVNCCAFTAM